MPTIRKASFATRFARARKMSTKERIAEEFLAARRKARRKKK